ncbi:MAG: Dps family protein [Bacteroides sp.]|jgi:non-specific DNA-binding protein dps
MNVLEITRMDAGKAAKMVDQLQHLLADMQIFYTNLRGFHWNVKGDHFYTLHKYFEDQYNAYATHIDDVAERILQLGGAPESHFSEYLKIAHVKEQCSKCSANDMMSHVAEIMGHLIEEERKILATAEDLHDNATNDLLNDILDEQEKAAWMLAAYLTCNDDCCKK